MRAFNAASRRVAAEIGKRDAALAAHEKLIATATARVDASISGLVDVSGIGRAAVLTGLDEARIRESVKQSRRRTDD